MVFWMVKWVGWVICFTHLGDFKRGLDIIHLSGKRIKFHQPRILWNKGISRNLSYLLGWKNVWGRYILTRVGRSWWNIIPTIDALDGDFDSLIFLSYGPGFNRGEQSFASGFSILKTVLLVMKSQHPTWGVDPIYFHLICFQRTISPPTP